MFKILQRLLGWWNREEEELNPPSTKPEELTITRNKNKLIYVKDDFPIQEQESHEEYRKKLVDIYGENFGTMLFDKYLIRYKRAKEHADLNISIG